MCFLRFFFVVAISCSLLAMLPLLANKDEYNLLCVEWDVKPITQETLTSTPKAGLPYHLAGLRTVVAVRLPPLTKRRSLATVQPTTRSTVPCFLVCFRLLSR